MTMLYFCPRIIIMDLLNLRQKRRSGSVVDNTFVYHPGIARSIPRFSDLSDETLNRLRMTSLLVGR